MRLLVVPLLVLSLLASGYTYREQRALNVAKQAWHTLPCNGQINLLRFDNHGDNIGAFTDVENYPCTIWESYEVIATPWPIYCSIIVHEVGHLLGYKHSSDPHNVMYPSMTNYWRCFRR